MDKKLHDYEVFEENPLSKVWIVGTTPKDVSINPDKDKYNIYIANQHHYRENIDKLNRIWCEYCGMYYVWKNNLRSDFVGFCHYRRLIDVGEEEREKIKENNSIMYFSQIISNHGYSGDYAWLERQTSTFKCPSIVVSDSIEYLNNQNFVSQDKLKEICNMKGVPFYNREIFYTTWSNFGAMMEFLNGYFEFIKKKYNISNTEEWKTHVSEVIIKHYKNIYPEIRTCIMDKLKTIYCYQTQRVFKRIFDEDEGFSQYCNCWRIYAYIIELLISLWIASHPNSRGNSMFEDFNKNYLNL